MFCFIFFLLLTFIKSYSIDVAQCCRQLGVSDVCTNFLCNPEKPPDDFNIYDLFNQQNNCSAFMNDIGQCLSQRRNHTECCIDEAYDKDHNACFSLCEGKGIDQQVPWSRYQSCLAVNMQSMFGCFVKGYKDIPLPPTNIQIDKISSHSIKLSWIPPETENPLDLKYEVVYDEYLHGSDIENAEFFEETSDNQAILKELYPGTKYYVYVITVSSDGSKRSLASDIVYFHTVGIPPIIQAFKNHVFVPAGAPSVILACRFQTSGTSIPTIEWQQKLSGNSEFQDIDKSKVVILAYKSFYDLREYVTTLEIKEPSSNDLGVYKCVVSDQYGSASANVELNEAEVSKADAEPPETILDCCHRKEVSRRCLAMCGDTTNTDIIRSPYIPKNCSNELKKVISCSMPKLDESQCCLKNQVPMACMYLCDSSFPASHFMPEVCAVHVKNFANCRREGIITRPSAVKDLKAITNLENDETFLEWSEADKAEIYHVYWKKIIEHDWQMKSTKNTKIKIDQADEIRVVAANSYGISQAVELNL